MTKDQLIELLSNSYIALTEMTEVALNITDRDWGNSAVAVNCPEAYTKAAKIRDEIKKQFLICEECRSIINIEHGSESLVWNNQKSYHVSCAPEQDP